MTGQDIITAALKLLGVIDPGASPNATESADALIVLNNLILSWDLERLNVPVIQRLTHAMTTGVSTYTCGASGTFTGTRLLRIEKAGTLLVVNGQIVREPADVVGFDKFAEVSREQTRGGVVIDVIYYDYNFPSGTINVFPVPTFTSGTPPQLEIYAWAPLGTVATLGTALAIPPGYERPLTAALAFDLAPQYSVTPSPALLQSLNEGKAALRAINAAPPGTPPPGGPLNAIPPAPPQAA